MASRHQASSNTTTVIARERDRAPSPRNGHESPMKGHVQGYRAQALDPYMLSQPILAPIHLRILGAVTRRPMTAKELVKYLRLPYTTCYRHLNWIVKKGLLKENKARTKDGNLEYKVYSSEIESLTLHFDDDEFSLDISLKNVKGKTLTYRQRL